MSVFKFTPGLVSGEQIARATVGREGLLSHCTEKICNAVRDGRTINMIFVGPRGIGKSHAALALLHELECRKAATPARLSEQDYPASSLSEFFSKVLRALGESPDQDAVEHARQVFRTCSRRGRPVVILAENIRELFGEMERDLPHLRSLMLEDQNFFIVGTALSTFDQITSLSAAFYNFFELNRLKGLDASDVGELMRLRLGGRPDGARTVSAMSPGGLRVLTGGNPRLVHMMCDIMERKGSPGGLKEHAADLLDGITPFYRERLEAMPSEQRKVLDALALSDGPSAPTEIAAALGLKNTAVTACLARLRSGGTVGRVKLREKKETRYQVSDRTCRMWREFRARGGQKAAAFAGFLESWYQRSGPSDGRPPGPRARAPDAGAAQLGLCAARRAGAAVADGRELEAAVRRRVAKGDHRGARRAIKKFRDAQTGARDPLLSACAEIAAKNAERLVPDGRGDRASAVLADMEKVCRMLKNCEDRGVETTHAVSETIELAVDLDLDLAGKIYGRARSRLGECRECMCLAHHQISILTARGRHGDALKAANDALASKRDLALIARRTEIRANLGDKAAALQDVRLLPESDKFLHAVVCTHSCFGMFADVRRILQKNSRAVKSMEKEGRDYMAGYLIARAASALQDVATGTKDFQDALGCVKLLKPYVTPDVVSALPASFLMRHCHSVEKTGRALDALFEALDEDQLGMLTVLKCAVDYARRADTDTLERLHPEQRELALEIISEISPDTRIPYAVRDSIR